MIINLSPVFSDKVETLDLLVQGEVITVNGEEFDFSVLPYGYTLPADAIESSWFTGPVVRDHAGCLSVIIRFPHPYDADETLRFPEPVIVTKDGPVDLPIHVPKEAPVYEDFTGPSSEDPNTGELGGTGIVPEGYPVSAIDGLDGDPADGDEEGNSGSGTEETGGSPGTSDRGDR